MTVGGWPHRAERVFLRLGSPVDRTNIRTRPPGSKVPLCQSYRAREKRSGSDANCFSQLSEQK
jgi:hypothetical protein